LCNDPYFYFLPAGFIFVLRKIGGGTLENLHDPVSIHMNDFAFSKATTYVVKRIGSRVKGGRIGIGGASSVSVE
jgi:hypothetical protein